MSKQLIIIQTDGTITERIVPNRDLSRLVEAIQHEVGGYFEVVNRKSLRILDPTIKDRVKRLTLYVNEDGQGLQDNVAFPPLKGVVVAVKTVRRV